MKIINIGLIIICTILTSAVFAQAADKALAIDNKTGKEFSYKINGRCSTILGSNGVTKAHSLDQLSLGLLSTMCTEPENCNAIVYQTNNCTGKPIGTLTFNKQNGITNIQTDENSALAIAGHNTQLFIREFS